MLKIDDINSSEERTVVAVVPVQGKRTLIEFCDDVFSRHSILGWAILDDGRSLPITLRGVCSTFSYEMDGIEDESGRVETGYGNHFDSFSEFEKFCRSS